MRLRRQVDRDRVTRSNHTANEHDAHHASFPDDVATRVTRDHLAKQAGLKILDLYAWVAQTGDFYHRRITDTKLRSGG